MCWSVTPQLRIEAECARRGRDAVIAGCVRLVDGLDVDDTLLLVLGGPSARRMIAGTSRADASWRRVWGARGLLWAWDDSATPALRTALRDDAWRVREMAAKVVARHLVGELLDVVAALRTDHVPRVRAAAERATVRLVARGA